MRRLLNFLSVLLFIVYVYGEPWKRIAGGQPANKGQFPFFVQLIITKLHTKQLINTTICGGTLLHPKWILSAAHCFALNESTTVQISPDMFNRNLVQAMMGSEKRATQLNDPNLVVRNLEKVIFHSNFTSDGLNDIAVASLKQPFTLNEHIKTVVFAGEKAVPCRRAVVVGAGEIDNQGRYPPTVRYTKIALFLRNFSPSIFSETKFLNNHPYYGDSGGPLMCSSIQHGIVGGWFPVSKDKMITAIYESVNIHVAFIKQHVPLRSFYGKRTARTKGERNKDAANPQEASKSNGSKNSVTLCLAIVYIIMQVFNEMYSLKILRK